MAQILLKAFSFVFIIALGYGLKKSGLFGPRDYQVMVKVVLNMTLPAAVITSFASMRPDWSLLWVTVLGLGVNWMMLGLGALLTRRGTRADKALFMLGLPGHNIGAFALPYTQSFLGPAGVVAACLFDAGNSIMCTGGTYAIVGAALEGRGVRGVKLSSVGRRLLSSTPFVTYVTMLLLTMADLHIPQGVVQFISPIAAANPYAAMLMIGLMFELDLRPEYLRKVGAIVLLRTVYAVAAALVFYFCTPFSLQTRQVLALVVFAPSSVLTPAFCEKCGGDAGMASCAGSLCILTSIVGMTSVLVLLGIA